MAAFSPVRFGKYLLLDPIAVGGMAELFRAKMLGDAGFEKLIVVKKILPHLVQEKELVESFIYEARLAAHLQHENIIRTYDFGRMQDDYFISMEFLFGKNLRFVLEQAKAKRISLGMGNILHVMALVCSGLDYAHSLKDFAGNDLSIVHRDISPPNIFITYDGHVKVVDFGVAKAASKNSTTQHGVIKGKVAYMSPEQALGQEIDHRSDIFAVGSILYEMVTGKMMYEGETMQVLAKAQKAEFEPAENLANISKGLAIVLKRALAKDREERYQTCGAMQAGLEDVMVELSVRPSQRVLASYITALFDEELPKEQALLREVAAVQAQDYQLVPVEEAPPPKIKEEPSEKILTLKKVRKPAPTAPCPSCGKPADPDLDYCPWCDAPIKGAAPIAPAQATMVSCSSCGKPVKAHYKICNYCGANMQAGVPDRPGRNYPAAGVSPGQSANNLPVVIYFNAGKKIAEKTMDFLEMAVANTGPAPVEGLKVSIRGTLIARVLEEKLPFPLEPGRPYALNVPGFLPRCAGNDSLHLSVEGRGRDGEPFFLLGTIPVEVSAKDEAAPNVNVNISAKGPLIVDLEDAIPGLTGKKAKEEDPSAPQWIPLELHPDLEKQESASRKFPPACVSSLACTLDEAVASAIHAVSPDAAPMAEFKCPDGTVYTIVPGASLLLGRKRDINHVPAFLFPEEAHEGENVKVSRNHCRIFVRKNRVFIRDTSSNGTFLGKERLPSKEDVMLSTGELVVVGGVLELRADIFTNGKDVIAVRLKRQNNKTNERYILAHGPVPLGPGNGNPIQVAGAPSFLGAIYYNPLVDKWLFRPLEGFASNGKDMILPPKKDLSFGKAKCRFEILQPD
ncbi:serine/threonine protein kinase with FHA domain [Desulfatibacillum aliphaticivorans]|uniref:Serine/threonine protein kinase with FHA domain n=1 Tax=Desulfatibacillum aliphaticivorans TaxID=218208 RepID=B8FJ03_DESAL|nr:protein kinase [Desulfatibacillum aliphaticivorans]ACL04394.1 serine/threonine protein kinase with FHA domain [Desulfatibacillum aliphaticivorans]